MESNMDKKYICSILLAEYIMYKHYFEDCMH